MFNRIAAWYENRESIMIVIIGGGPAGLSAALAASSGGAEVVLLDCSPRLGGQYWRHLPDNWDKPLATSYKYAKAEAIFTAVRNSPNITWISSAQVWSAEKVEEGIKLNYIQSGQEFSRVAEKLILATGAYDRTLPFPGWDIPGVMTPGAAQSMLKSQGVLVGKKILLSGTGPFLLPVATGLVGAQGKVVGIYDANSPSNWFQTPLAVLQNPRKILEAFYYARKLFKYRLRQRFGYMVRSAHAGQDGTLEYVLLAKSGSKDVMRVDCDIAAIGWGFTPDLSLVGILDLQRSIAGDGTVAVKVDGNQKSSDTNIYAAGEVTGIGGSDLALVEGEIAGLSAIGVAIPRALLRKRKALNNFAEALIKNYPTPVDWIDSLKTETTICRCEEVTLGQIQDSVISLGADSERSSKLLSRAGMGMCQGRICSRNVMEIVADCHGHLVTDSERISSTFRPIAAPISLGLLGDGLKER